MKKYTDTLILFVLISVSMVITSAHAADYKASLQFAHKVTLSVPVTGEVAQVNAVAGKQINNGEILLSLNKIPFEAAVAQAEADVQKQAAAKRIAERDLDKLNELYDRGVLSRVELENGELDLQRASANYNAAQAKLTRARYNLDHALITAPFDGLVLDVRVKPFESINNNVTIVPLITVAKKDKYTAVAYTPLSEARKLKPGSKSRVSVGSASFTGVVSSVALEPEESERVYEVRVEFDSNGKLLRAGESASISF